MINKMREWLESGYPSEFVGPLIDSYVELKRTFQLGRFKPSELEGGFFVECVRRIIEHQLFETIVPIGQNLRRFNSGELTRYEQGQGDSSFCIHIPRVLWSIYSIRNQRGVGHLAQLSANIMDSTYILSACDWVMAELVRLAANASPEECQRTIDAIVQRRLPIVYEDGDIQRVLNTKLRASEQVLVLLYHNSNPVSDSTLCKWIEYSNQSVFRARVLKTLHGSRHIEYRDDVCKITPLGIKLVEESILKEDDVAAHTPWPQTSRNR